MPPITNHNRRNYFGSGEVGGTGRLEGIGSSTGLSGAGRGGAGWGRVGRGGVGLVEYVIKG